MLCDKCHAIYDSELGVTCNVRDAITNELIVLNDIVMYTQRIRIVQQTVHQTHMCNALDFRMSGANTFHTYSIQAPHKLMTVAEY